MRARQRVQIAETPASVYTPTSIHQRSLLGCYQERDVIGTAAYSVRFRAQRRRIMTRNPCIQYVRANPCNDSAPTCIQLLITRAGNKSRTGRRVTSGLTPARSLSLSLRDTAVASAIGPACFARPKDHCFKCSQKIWLEEGDLRSTRTRRRMPFAQLLMNAQTDENMCQNYGLNC